MAMPSSGAISLANVESEHFHDDPNHSVPTIQVSLTDFSISAWDASGTYEEWDRKPNMTGGTPHALSEFYSAHHEFGGGE